MLATSHSIKRQLKQPNNPSLHLFINVSDSRKSYFCKICKMLDCLIYMLNAVNPPSSASFRKGVIYSVSRFLGCGVGVRQFRGTLAISLTFSFEVFKKIKRKNNN